MTHDHTTSDECSRTLVTCFGHVKPSWRYRTGALHLRGNKTRHCGRPWWVRCESMERQGLAREWCSLFWCIDTASVLCSLKFHVFALSQDPLGSSRKNINKRPNFLLRVTRQGIPTIFYGHKILNHHRKSKQKQSTQWDHRNPNSFAVCVCVCVCVRRACVCVHKMIAVRRPILEKK